MLSARKEAGKFTEGVILSKNMEVLFRAVPPSLYLALAPVIRTITALGASLAAMSDQNFLLHHATERQRFDTLVKAIGLRVD